MGISCTDLSLTLAAAQCVTTNEQARVGLDDVGTFGLSANDAVAQLAMDGTVLLDNSSTIEGREVSARIDMAAGLPVAELEQELDNSGEDLGQVCHQQLLRVPVTVSASIDTVGDTSGDFTKPIWRSADSFRTTGQRSARFASARSSASQKRSVRRSRPKSARGKAC